MLCILILALASDFELSDDAGYSVTGPEKVYIGSNVVVEFRLAHLFCTAVMFITCIRILSAPGSHWRTDWIGLFRSGDSSCHSRLHECWLSWYWLFRASGDDFPNLTCSSRHQIPPGHEGVVHLYQPHIVEPGMYCECLLSCRVFNEG